MTAYDTTRVEVGPGTLYAAPLGTSEPTSVSGAWPTGWVELGYTDAGSTFSYQLATSPVPVEEELFPAKIVTTGATATLAFALAELTRQNLLVVLNAGIGSSLVSGTTGTGGSDSSIYAEMPDAGTEVRIMLGWDAIPKGGTTATDVKTMSRLIARQCLQTGNLSVVRRKGPNKATFNGTFSLEKPASSQPFRFWFPPQMAS